MALVGSEQAQQDAGSLQTKGEIKHLHKSLSTLLLKLWKSCLTQSDSLPAAPGIKQ